MVIPCLLAAAVAGSLTVPGTTPADASAGSPFPGPVGGELLGATDEPVVGAADVPDLPDVEAEAWLVADLDSGTILATRNAHVPLPPASTIKLLTALAVLPHVDPDAAYTSTDDDARVEGSRVGLVPDERYSVTDLEHGLLLASGNDAAYALGELAGGQQAAVDLMNAEAARLGAFSTHAVTTHGLDESGQVSSAYDLALVGRAALADEHLATLVATGTYDFPGLDGETYQIQNQNRLLRAYDGALGLKTGYTSKAGHTLVAAAERDGLQLVVSVLGSEGRAENVAADLLDWGFAAAGTAEPVGTLITPDDVEAAREAAEAAAEAEPDGEAAAGPATATPGSALAADAAGRIAAASSSRWGWAATGVAGLVLLAVWWRLRRRRSMGRYAA